MKLPGPDHPITIEPCRSRVVVSVAQIEGHLAFYPDRVGSMEITEDRP